MVRPQTVALTLARILIASASTLPSITIPSGVLIGTTTSVPLATDVVHQYLGVPFASPPERFSPPQDPQAWSEARNASTYKPACIQQFMYPKAAADWTKSKFNDHLGPNGQPPQESEDCLYLNVFVPSTPAPVDGFAVMVWFYGGALQFGTGSLMAYDGSSFAANQHVIIVTTNYRTNVFGYSNSPEIELEKRNSGFLDQRKALQWVQQNIENFGGNPYKVTIFGESAGGYSVKQLVANPPDPLPFRAAIMQSEATGLADGTAAYDELVNLTNCTSAESQLSCLRDVPALTLKNLIEVHSLNFSPSADNITQTLDFRTSIEEGRAAKIPLLIGTNQNEGTSATSRDNLDEMFSSAQDFLNSTFPGQIELQATLLAAYSDLTDDLFAFISAVLTDWPFHCPAASLGNVAHENGSPVWRYLYGATFTSPLGFPKAGAFHASEIEQVFGTFPSNASGEQYDLSRYMQRAWANFAKEPELGPGWPRLGSNAGLEIGALGLNGTGGLDTVSVDGVDGICDAWRDVIDASPI